MDYELKDVMSGSEKIAQNQPSKNPNAPFGVLYVAHHSNIRAGEYIPYRPAKKAEWEKHGLKEFGYEGSFTSFKIYLK